MGDNHNEFNNPIDCIIENKSSNIIGNQKSG